MPSSRDTGGPARVGHEHTQAKLYLHHNLQMHLHNSLPQKSYGRSKTQHRQQWCNQRFLTIYQHGWQDLQAMTWDNCRHQAADINTGLDARGAQPHCSRQLPIMCKVVSKCWQARPCHRSSIKMCT